MDRRTYLQSVGVALAAGLTGCAAEDAARDDGARNENGPRVVDVRAVPPVTEGREFRTELRVEWTYRGADFLNPDEAKWRFPRGDMQHVLCQFRVTNVGDRAVPVSPEMFQLAAYSRDQQFKVKSIDDPDQFPERRLDPEDVANGWVVFGITHMREVFLLALDQDSFPDPVDATFERTDLPFTLDDDDTGTTAPDRTTEAESGS